MAEFFEYFMHPITFILILLAPFLGIGSSKNSACALSWAGGLLIWGIELFDILTKDNVGHWYGMIGGIIVYYVIFVTSWNLARKRQENKRIAELNAKKRAERAKIENGQWSFPKKAFYIKCKKANISPFDSDEFSMKKIDSIVTEFYNEVDLPQKYRDIHNSKLEDYFNEGKDLYKIDCDESKRKMRIPTENQGNVSECVDYLIGQACKDLRGVEKRQAHLDVLILEAQTGINEYVDMLNKLGGMGGVHYSKGESWVPAAVVGTLLGGTAVGTLAGLSVIEKNEKNRQIDQRLNEVGAYISNEASKLACQITPALDSARERKREYIAEHKASESKIVLENPTSQEIAEKIKVNSIICEKTENSVIRITANITNKLSRPPKGEFVLDGTIHGKVYADDIFIDDAVISLPVVGIPFGKTEYAFGCCLKSVSVNKVYRFEITDYNLFLIEAPDNKDIIE